MLVTNAKDVAWRACYRQDGYTVVWYVAKVGPVSGEMLFNYRAYWLDETGSLRGGGGGAPGERRGDYWFSGMTSSSETSWATP